MERVEKALKATEDPRVQSIQIIFNTFRHRPSELFFEQAADLPPLSKEVMDQVASVYRSTSRELVYHYW